MGISPLRRSRYLLPRYISSVCTSMQTTAPLSTMTSRRRHERTLESQCACGTIDSSRGMRALRLSGIRGSLYPPPSSTLGENRGRNLEAWCWRLNGDGGGGDTVRGEAADGLARQVRVEVDALYAAIL
jgi:hypothetical protein